MSRTTDPRRRAHGRLAFALAGVAVLMTGAAFAAVPLYKAFCQATGFGGAIPRASSAPGQVLSRTVDVYFDTNVRGVPWTFEPLQHRQTVKVGATSMAYFKVVNNSDQPVTGRAAYNVDPETAGAHVRKLQCFCFEAQTLQPHQSIEFPVVYFIEPAFASDPETRTYTDLTISYTFVPAPTPAHPRPAGSAAES